jgi:hypothetical protein
VSGVVLNSGTLIASGLGSLVEIVSGAVVSGGAVKVGNGIVDVLSGGSASISFLSTGSGGLEIADTHGSTSAFGGVVSGFGGANHTNHAQFIDLVGVTFSAGQITSSYVSAGGSGTPTVSSGGTPRSTASRSARRRSRYGRTPASLASRRPRSLHCSPPARR